MSPGAVWAPLGFLILLLLHFAAPARADSYQYLDFKLLHTEAEPFGYWVDDRPGAPLPLAEVEAATRAAFQTWQDVGCAASAFAFQGTSSDAGVLEVGNTEDPFSVSAIWVTDAGDPSYASSLAGGVAAAAAIPRHWGGVLETCDVFLNAVDFTWSTATPTPAGRLDLQTLLLHEIGHCQGLDHTVTPAGTVMDPALPYGAALRTLTVHDAEHLCRHLPSEGAVGSPCDADGGCTAGLSCLTPPLADGGTAAPFCTRGCAEDAACPFPFVCRDTTQLPGEARACLSASSGNVTRIGRSCTGSASCGSDVGVCLNWPEGYCSEFCDEVDPTCPAGALCGAETEACLQRCRLGYGGCRAGYACSYERDAAPLCRPACEVDSDCEAGALCRTCDGTCVAPEALSQPMGERCGSTSCPLGRVCLAMPGAPEGLCVQPCETACAACPSGSLCARLGAAGERFCVSLCEGGCPAGLRCTELPEGAACLPGCQSELDCPVGNVCVAGECENPFATPDAGDAAPSPDGGGLGGEQPTGCGCQTGGSPIWAALFAWILLGVRRR